ncbi:uncharacterized protein [Rhodnius prolixus]|uniref:uncharacterized protein n=1 Tax=Rhodnius prolixus TaxID=13249 RepID=UPI003D18B7D2
MESFVELTFQSDEHCLPIDIHLGRKSTEDSNCDTLDKKEVENVSAYKMTFTGLTVVDPSSVEDAKGTFSELSIEQRGSSLEQNHLFYINETPLSQIMQPVVDNHCVILEVDRTDDPLTNALIQIATSEVKSSSTLSNDSVEEMAVSSEVEHAIESILNDVTSSDIKVSNEQNNDESKNNNNKGDKGTQKGKRTKKEKTEEQYECKECGKTYREKSHLATHSRAHINVRNFCCEVCGQRFKTKANLYFHSQTHSDTPFTCTECNKTFQERRILKRHIRVVHSHKELHKCNQCEKAFKSATVLSLHYTLHTGSKPFRCSMCPKTFVYKSTLATHVNQFHQCTTCLPSACRHSSRPWLCPVCGKGFSLKGTLNTHMRTHDPEKHFKCTECPKSFAHKQSYETHMKWHKGEGPQYKCDQCAKSYFNVFALRRHYLKHISQKNFICAICSKAYWMKDALKVHMRTHTNVRPFQCQRCPKAFLHKHTLEGHIIKSHQQEQQVAVRKELPLTPVVPVSSATLAPPTLPSIGPQHLVYYQLAPSLQTISHKEISSNESTSHVSHLL